MAQRKGRITVENRVWRLIHPLKTESRHDANSVIIGSTAGCPDDNLQCRQRWRSWYHDDSVAVSCRTVTLPRGSVVIGTNWWTSVIWSVHHEVLRWYQPAQALACPSPWDHHVATQTSQGQVNFTCYIGRHSPQDMSKTTNDYDFSLKILNKTVCGKCNTEKMFRCRG